MEEYTLGKNEYSSILVFPIIKLPGGRIKNIYYVVNAVEDCLISTRETLQRQTGVGMSVVSKRGGMILPFNKARKERGSKAVRSKDEGSRELLRLEDQEMQDREARLDATGRIRRYLDLADQLLQSAEPEGGTDVHTTKDEKANDKPADRTGRAA